MKKIGILHILPLYFLLFSCNENSINPVDQMLQKDILGTWQDENKYTVTFFPNGSFTDTTKYFNPDSTSQIYGYFVRKGKYTISNAVLKLEDFYFDTTIAFINLSVSLLSRPSFISINNSVMKRKFFDEFDKIDRLGTDIWSKWELKGWYCWSDPIPFGDRKNHYGTYKLIYQFFKDSSKCSVTYSFYNKVNDTTSTHSQLWDFKYTPPYLYIPPNSNYPSKIEINKSKMYWYSSLPVSDLIKVK